MQKDSVYYSDYLQLEKILKAQRPMGKVHDEHLFIVVHQVYELWFKQITCELKSIVDIFKNPPIPEKLLAKVVSRLERIQNIQRLFPIQFEILETMTPMDFLEFRNFLLPASGFQSVQFRKVEILMGLTTKNRAIVSSEFFWGQLSDGDKKDLLKQETMPSLFDLVEQWLERMPFAQTDNFNFWREYEKAVESMLKEEEKIIQLNPDEKGRKALLKNLQSTQKTFNSLLKTEDHFRLVEKGERRFSQKAVLNALFIMLFRDEPILAWPFRILHCLTSIDENFTSWRYRHSLLAHRMLGSKIGTGGSSGHRYLKTTAEKHRIFKDLFNISTFLIPKNALPQIPVNVKKDMDFVFKET